MVMAEVTSQLKPLEAKVDRATNAVERLYNTNGGPPGFLQTARAEDNKRFEMIFNILDEHKEAMTPLSNFLLTHSALDAEREKRIKRFFALCSLIVSIFMALLELYSHREAIIHSLETPPAVQHSQIAPQDAGIPTSP